MKLALPLPLQVLNRFPAWELRGLPVYDPGKRDFGHLYVAEGCTVAARGRFLTKHVVCVRCDPGHLNAAVAWQEFVEQLEEANRGPADSV